MQTKARVIIEILGKPKEHVENSMKLYLKNIKEDKNFTVAKLSVAEVEQKDELFATFAELEITCKKMEHLVGFCFDYMPSSVEILEPEAVELSAIDASDLFNDLQARLHNVDMIAKKLTNENEFLKKNLHTLLTNFLGILLVAKQRTSKELAALSGISEQEVEEFLKHLVAKGKVKKEGEHYKLHGSQKSD